jgi:hypothetical protein
MIAIPRPGRGSKLVLTAATAALMLLTGCASNSKPNGGGQLGQVSGPVTTPGGTGGGTPSTGPTNTPTITPTTPHTPPPASHAYPSDYAKEILLAWAARDRSYLTLLTDTSTANQILGWGNINTHWTLINGEGAAGSNYATYYNNGGDYIVIRTVNDLVSRHQWQAGSIQTWDQMTFPVDATQYTKELVDGWISGNKARMSFLGSTALTTTLLGLTTPSTGYSIPTPTSTSVEIKDPTTGLDAVLALDATKLGHQHAITGCISGC